jgi:hypothetical protein
MFYPFAVASLLLQACAGMKELALPEKLDSSFRSATIVHRPSKNSIQVFGYRAYGLTVLQSGSRDSMLTSGLIIPRTYLVANGTEKKMSFGTDSLKCDIHYTTIDIYTSSNQSSVLIDILLPPAKRAPGYDPYATTNTPLARRVTGTIRHPALNDEAAFDFQHIAARKNSDSAHIGGYLRIGTDSMIIVPFYKTIPVHSKNAKSMQVLQGYELVKGDTLVAFLQHAPMVKTVYKPGLKDVLYIRTGVSEAGQLVIAAYFSVVSRLVLVWAGEALY